MSADGTTVKISSRLSVTVWHKSDHGGSWWVDFWVDNKEVDPAIDHLQDLKDFMQDRKPEISDPEDLVDAVTDRLIEEHG